MVSAPGALGLPCAFLGQGPTEQGKRTDVDPIHVLVMVHQRFRVSEHGVRRRRMMRRSENVKTSHDEESVISRWPFQSEFCKVTSTD